MNISGVVRDEKGVGLSKATIRVVFQKDSLSIVSTGDGEFTFQCLPGNGFDVKITMEGYRSFRQSYIPDPGKPSFMLPIIVLTASYQELAPVTVLKIKPFIIKGDTLEYNADAYLLQPGAELERLLRRLPGAYWDMDGNLMMEGKKIEQLRINGQDYMGGDIKKAFQNLPADIIGKVQVIDDYGDEARLTGVKSNDPIKVLNLVLKESTHESKIGRIDAGLGNKGRYDGEASSEFLSGEQQFILNGKLANTASSGNLNEFLLETGYANKWSPEWSGKGNASVWGDNHNSGSSMTQDNYFAGSQQHENQNSLLSGYNRNELFGYTQTYTPNVNIKLRLNGFVGFYNDQESASINYQSSEQDSGFSKSGSGQSLNINHTNTLAIGSDLYFEKVNPHNNERMSIESFFQYNDKEQDANNKSQTQSQTDSVSSISIQNLIQHVGNASKELNVKLNYYFPLGKGGLLELGPGYDAAITGSNKLTQTPDSINKIFLTIDSLSNNYTYTTQNSFSHVDYLKHSGKINLTLSLYGEALSLQGETGDKGSQAKGYHYLVALPQTKLLYSFARGQKLRFEYSSTITMPTLQQLQPLIDLSNPEYPIQGNPNLRPSYVHSSTLKYEKSFFKGNQYGGFTIGLSYKTITNMIITNLVYSQDTSSAIQKTYYANANGFYSLNSHYRLDIPALLHNHLKISLWNDITESRNAIMTDNVLYYASNITWNQALQFGLDYPDHLEMNLIGIYTHTFAKYSFGDVGPYSYPGFNWSFHSKYNALQKWVLECWLSQIYTGTPRVGLQANPVLWNASVYRDLFRMNQAKISVSVNNILNGSSGISQYVTPTGISKYQTDLIGRYFLLTITIKLEKSKSYNQLQNVLK